MPIEANNIEIRSEEIDDMLGKAPSSIIRWGITVISFVIALIFIGSFFYRYPDVINSEITVLTENTPAIITAKGSGKIDQLLVVDKQKVRKGTLLAVVENTARFNDVQMLKSQVMRLETLYKTNVDGLLPEEMFDNSLVIGDLQAGYSSLQKAVKDYTFFIKTDFLHKKIASIRSQVEKHNAMYKKLQRQVLILAEQLNLTKRQYLRDSSLFKGAVIAEAEYERSQTAYLQGKYSFESSISSLDNMEITVAQLQQSILELEQQFNDQKKQYEIGLSAAIDGVKSMIKTWEQTYVMYSPIAGKVSFAQVWSINQSVKMGDNVMTIVPENQMKIVGRIKLPIAGSGKVKAGQRVNIKFVNFPYMEYGMVTGKINNIALVPTESFYMAEVLLPQGLKTNYNRSLPFSQEMKGSAEVITEDVRLIERFFNPLKAMLKNAKR